MEARRDFRATRMSDPARAATFVASAAVFFDTSICRSRSVRSNPPSCYWVHCLQISNVMGRMFEFLARPGGSLLAKLIGNHEAR